MNSEYCAAIENFEAAVRAQQRLELNPEQFTQKQARNAIAAYVAEKEYLQDLLDSASDGLYGEEE